MDSTMEKPPISEKLSLSISSVLPSISFMEDQPLSSTPKVSSAGVISILKPNVPIKSNNKSNKGGHLSSLPNHGGAGPSVLSSAAIVPEYILRASYPAAIIGNNGVLEGSNLVTPLQNVMGKKKGSMDQGNRAGKPTHGVEEPNQPLSTSGNVEKPIFPKALSFSISSIPSFPTDSSSKKERKKLTAKKGKGNSSQAKDPRILNIIKISETDKIIHCNACILDTYDRFRISFVYGSNDERFRKALRQIMCSSQHASPWIMLGDFNVSRNMGESIGGCSRISGAMEEFNDYLQASELDDLCFSGFLHTWCNKRSNSCISKKLDRVLVNNDWLVKFENSEAIFLPPTISDHCPSAVKLGLQGIKKNHPFKFFNFLTDRADFLQLVERCWQEQVHGIMQYKLCFKLRNLKKVLKTLNNDEVGNLTTNSIEAKAALDDCQRLLDQRLLDSNLRNRENELLSYYTLTLQAKEDLLRQKSRIQWLKAGDRNSSYFFKAINGRGNRSKIHSITGDDGSLIEGDIPVKNEAIHHFQNILGCSMLVRHGIGTLSNIIDNVISNDHDDSMDRDVTNDEIREVCFSLHPNKAPGPDGFNAYFFKKTWDIVSEDVINDIQEFFRSGHLLKDLSTTILALVPKVPNPSKLKDFRPISCCNTLYKIIAKIIAI
ncbi:hypothetical protein Ddye_013035 [Dipteronia dyeriana]|uniref:Uncharacterized protein n=1 Tax=Dipteronia dyeriana TaxID=168575 RepID=A0AAD9X5J6_9ROSI|nr:hypothetical protein Ddye_013035 [Dipteronia dyeriana]